MVLSLRGATLVVIVLFAASFAGCVGEDDPPATSDDSNLEQPNVPSPSVSLPVDNKTLVKVDKTAAIFAPTWEQGDWWKYKAEGTMHPGGEPTFKVIEVADDHYVLGSDNEMELSFNMLHNGPWMSNEDAAGIQMDSLALYSDDSYQDYIGFLRPVGAEWEIVLLGYHFTVKKAVQTIEGPKGPTPGILVYGTATNDDQIYVEYASDAKWVNKFVVTNATNVTKYSYTLLDYGRTGGPAVKSWDRTNYFHDVAQSPTYPAAFGPNYEESDGSGSLMLVIFHLRNGFDNGQAHTYVLPPGETEPMTASITVGDEWHYLPRGDASGVWLVQALALGGDEVADRAYADIWLMQVKSTDA